MSQLDSIGEKLVYNLCLQYRRMFQRTGTLQIYANSMSYAVWQPVLHTLMNAPGQWHLPQAGRLLPSAGSPCPRLSSKVAYREGTVGQASELLMIAF